MATRKERLSYDDFAGDWSASRPPSGSPPSAPGPHDEDHRTDLRTELEAALALWRTTRLSRSAPTHTAWLTRESAEPHYTDLARAVPLGAKAWLLGSLQVLLDGLDAGTLALAPDVKAPISLSDLPLATAPFVVRYVKHTCGATSEMLSRLTDAARRHSCPRAELTTIAMEYAYAAYRGLPLPHRLTNTP